MCGVDIECRTGEARLIPRLLRTRSSSQRNAVTTSTRSRTTSYFRIEIPNPLQNVTIHITRGVNV